MKKVLIDTNVLIGAAFNEKPSESILNLAANKKIEGFVTAFSIHTFHYIVQKQLKYSFSLEFAKYILSVCVALEEDQETLLQVYTSNWKDKEDAALYLISVKYQIDLIITNNIKDFSKSTKAVYTPNMFVRQFKNLTE